jgi:AraC-like DNA-binding protein
LAFGQPASILTLRISKKILQRHVGSPERLVGVPICGSSGAGSLASRVIREIWQSTDETLVPAVAPRVANVVLELIASAYVDVVRAKVDRSCLGAALRLRILDCIDQSLCDPDLSPVTIAQALKISTRHVHRVFHQDGDTVARYILRRRLDKCRMALDDPMLTGLSLTHISTEFGFRSLPHFSRVFRDEFGIAPRDFRRAVTTGVMSPCDKPEVARR